jgi:hypothetical protein
VVTTVSFLSTSYYFSWLRPAGCYYDPTVLIIINTDTDIGIVDVFSTRILHVQESKLPSIYNVVEATSFDIKLEDRVEPRAATTTPNVLM